MVLGPQLKMWRMPGEPAPAGNEALPPPPSRTPSSAGASDAGSAQDAAAGAGGCAPGQPGLGFFLVDLVPFETEWYGQIWLGEERKEEAREWEKRCSAASVVRGTQEQNTAPKTVLL